MKRLHILNGDSTLLQLQKTSVEGETLVWRDILCEGPTKYEVGSDDFWHVRQEFMAKRYDVAHSDYQAKSIGEFQIMKSDFDEIILWFEYDLFCQINMLAMLSFLYKNGYSSNVSLICVGEFPPYNGLVGLGQIDSKYYSELFDNRQLLSPIDLMFADQHWKLYCNQNHQLLFDELNAPLSFPYLKQAFKAHQKRFYDQLTGLNEIETKALQLINEEQYTNHSLVGALLRWDEFYGFGDMQYFEVINDLSPLINEDNTLSLNDIGRKVLDGTIDFSDIRKNVMIYGGAPAGQHV